MSAGPYTATADEIAFVCRYMNDDRAVAEYFGISPQRVERVRLNMRPPRPVAPTGYKHPTRSEQVINRLDRIEEEHAAAASRRLNAKLQSLFRKWEDENGFQPGAGQILLPAGYQA